MSKIKLKCELIPRTSFFTNVRSEVTPQKWDKLRRHCYKKAGHKCEICGGKGSKWPVECHEVWSYKVYKKDRTKGIQKLVRLIALCPSCHEVKHIGLAQLRGRMDKALKHLTKVNKVTEEEAHEIVDEAVEIWERRNEVSWKLDLSHLDEITD